MHYRRVKLRGVCLQRTLMEHAIQHKRVKLWEDCLQRTLMEHAIEHKKVKLWGGCLQKALMEHAIQQWLTHLFQWCLTRFSHTGAVTIPWAGCQRRGKCWVRGGPPSAGGKTGSCDFAVTTPETHTIRHAMLPKRLLKNTQQVMWCCQNDSWKTHNRSCDSARSTPEKHRTGRAILPHGSWQPCLIQSQNYHTLVQTGCAVLLLSFLTTTPHSVPKLWNPIMTALFQVCSDEQTNKLRTHTLYSLQII